METDRRLCLRQHPMGHDSGPRGEAPLEPGRTAWIETFRSRSRLDLRAHWRRWGGAPNECFALEDWGRIHRPDWASRGLLIWPRGRQWLRLGLDLAWPAEWDGSEATRARLCLSWWAEAARLWVDGLLVHEGDLFDTACRWSLPDRCRSGAVLRLQLELCSPLHDDGALINSWLDREPSRPGRDPQLSMLPESLDLHLAAGGDLPQGWQDLDPLSPAALAAVDRHLEGAPGPLGGVHWFGHAHLDLAWLWPVADTWQAAERTFRSVLNLMERWPDLNFGHSTPALYAWLERHRPALFASIQRASREGRWEPINGPWVETDCVLVSTASLWQQFAVGQAFSQRAFPEWEHHLAWLPDSFGFSAGLPSVARQNGVRWFCTHKLAWNATNPFPHRLFRWRGRDGSELLSLMLPPIGRRGDPRDMLEEQLHWQQQTGVDQALWIPGVGDHGGGPTQEMLEQMQLWDGAPQALPRRSGSLRLYLEELEPLAPQLPVWRDELYLELHRGCATSRPDQKRHNRTLERLLREGNTVAALLQLNGQTAVASDWCSLLFQQFHDILPGTSIPEVFDQAEPVWRRARREARQQRDGGLKALLAGDAGSWVWMGWQPLASWSPLLRLPAGGWVAHGTRLAQQPCPSGGVWVQLPRQQGISSVAMHLVSSASADLAAAQPRHPITVTELSAGGWQLSNGLLSCRCSAEGLVSVQASDGEEQLAGPLRLCRYRDRGEFWDAWDLAEGYRDQPLPIDPLTPMELQESGPLTATFMQRFRIGSSELRLDLRMHADVPWLELLASVDWSQRHELLRLEFSLARQAVRLAADTSGGVIERPARPCTPQEEARWEVPVISWVASQSSAPGGGLALLLDGPQGVDGTPDRLGVSLLRGATWPDPSADEGHQRMRLALMPVQGSWVQAGVPQAAIAFREPGWHGPVQRADSRSWLPPLPLQLTPIGISPGPSQARVRVLNPGASRCTWRPGGGWRVGRQQPDQVEITLKPGELVELVVTQSS